VDRSVDRPDGRPSELARARLRGQDVDALGTERDGVGDRRVVHNTAVDQTPVADGHRRKHPGIAAEATTASTAAPAESRTSSPATTS
jgi:hypothetical protein